MLTQMHWLAKYLELQVYSTDLSCFYHNILSRPFIVNYTSLILCQLNYGILVWGHNNNRVYKLQKRAVRIISCSKFNAHSEPLLKKLFKPSESGRYFEAATIKMLS